MKLLNIVQATHVKLSNITDGTDESIHKWR